MPDTPTAPTVLVVEDDDMIAQLLQFLLGKQGWQVRRAADGDAARAAIAGGTPPALVLLDVLLPGADGFELLADLRARPAWAAVPVLMLTGKADEETVRRASEGGAQGHVAKPFAPADLLARVRALVAG